MSGNRGVVYLGAGKVEVQSIPFPKMEDPRGKRIEHGVILRVVSTNICGSDQHMVRGRTTAQTGLVLGHEITGEVLEAGRDVEHLKVGDLVSVPFNVACGRCRSCKEQNTGVCLTVNPARPGGAYGYVDMGDWVGGQAEYVLVPYADFNLLKLPDRDAAMEKIRDLTCLSDILPTGYHGAVTAGVGPGSTVYVAGAGPVGLAAAASARLLGAAVVIVGDVNPTRL
ncbi:alcohol dehydrogenase catalytic domain-containing protein, partial [Pseudomonas syringae pv. actinidiae]|nr:alcohol dehydrogenase catalytic domain-containing protein [Pseudomonas syringae pv. actinidiae]